MSRDFARFARNLNRDEARATSGTERGKFVEKTADGLFVYDMGGGNLIHVAPGGEPQPKPGVTSRLTRQGGTWVLGSVVSGYGS